jgi:hypothetical protein
VFGLLGLNGAGVDVSLLIAVMAILVAIVARLYPNVVV